MVPHSPAPLILHLVPRPIAGFASLHECRHAPCLRRLEFEPHIDPFLQLGDVQNDPDHAAGLLQVLEGAYRRGEERLAAGERSDRPFRGGVLVEDLKIQARGGTLVTRLDFAPGIFAGFRLADGRMMGFPPSLQAPFDFRAALARWRARTDAAGPRQ